MSASYFAAGLISSTGHSVTGTIADTGTGTGAIIRYTSEAGSALKALIGEIPFRYCHSKGVILALLTGDRTYLEKNVEEYFRDSGAAHLLALSGMHLGVIYTIISKLASLAGNYRQLRFARFMALTASTGFYTLMTGAGPSIMRAYIFIVLNEICILSGRKKKKKNIFGAALLLQLSINPEVIVSAGFQLSYLAVGGIYMIYPYLKGWYKGDCISRKVWDSAAMSISCQILTAPVAWYHFGTFPMFFLLTNLIAIPLTTLSINLSVMAIIMHSAGICPDFLLTAIDITVKFLCQSLETISSLQIP